MGDHVIFRGTTEGRHGSALTLFVEISLQDLEPLRDGLSAQAQDCKRLDWERKDCEVEVDGHLERKK